MPDTPIVELPRVEAARLAAAVHAVVIEDRARAALLRAGAEQSVAAEPDDHATARRFQALLELGYLAASADGFADQEREALAALLENITGTVIDRDTLRLHFQDLDEAVATMGRRERLVRASADFEDGERETALGFATLIAMADGELHAPELAVLVELGDHFAMPAEQVRSVVDGLAGRVGNLLAEESAR